MTKKSTIDTDNLRAQFPAFKRTNNKKPLIFLDGPGGTQVPESVIRAVSTYYRCSNANHHGAFVTAKETDTVINSTREKMATFLGAESSHSISIGQNMTSLAFSLAKGFSRLFNPGEEVIITQLDHEANRGPWLTLRDNGIKVREVELNENGMLNYEDLKSKLNENTRLVAVSVASNLTGTVNDIPMIRNLCYQYGAWLLLDAVHYVPHYEINVQEVGCDFLLCSAYKFYGPHVGFLYSRESLLDLIPTDRLRTQEQQAPHTIETGTLNHAALAGVSAAVDFVASLGSGNTLRNKITSAYDQIRAHERHLARVLYAGLKRIQGINIIGLDMSHDFRTPTISFTMEGTQASRVCQKLAEENICAWDGHFYAIRAVEVLGLLEKGGVTRLGISVYNTVEEMEFTVDIIKKIASKEL